MRQEKHTITPEIAQRLLSVNTALQRPERGPQLRAFCEALRQGRFRLTHQGIAVTGASLDEPGSLIDGQTRMRAIIETGISADMWVAFDAEADIFDAIDRGANRTMPDLLTIRGYKNAKALTSAWQYAWCWERGRVSFSGTRRDDQIAALLERYPSLVDMHPLRQPEMIQQSILTFLGYIADSEEFTDDLIAHQQGTTAGVIAEQLVNNKKRHKSLQRRSVIGLVVKARNDHAKGVVPEKRYEFRPAEAFPRPEWNPPVPFDAVHNGDDDEDDE